MAQQRETAVRVPLLNYCGGWVLVEPAEPTSNVVKRFMDGLNYLQLQDQCFQCVLLLITEALCNSNCVLSKRSVSKVFNDWLYTSDIKPSFPAPSIVTVVVRYTCD
jgi:hypothetical protein